MATADLLGYLPYLLGIGSALAWYWQGVVRDAWTELHYLMRRHNLRALDGVRRSRSPFWTYLGEWGPCPPSGPDRRPARARSVAALRGSGQALGWGHGGR